MVYRSDLIVLSAVNFQSHTWKSYRNALGLNLPSDPRFGEVHLEISSDDILRFGQAVLNWVQVPSAESQQAAEQPTLLRDQRTPYCTVRSRRRQDRDEGQEDQICLQQ